MVLEYFIRGVALYAALCWAKPCFAQALDDVDETKLSKASALTTYQKLRRVEDDLLKALKTSEGELARINQQMNQVRIDLSEGNQRLNALEQERRTLETALAPITKTVRNRLKARQLSLKRGEAFLRLMVQKDGATAFLRSRGYLNAVANLDLKMLQSYQVRRRALANNTDRLSNSRQVLLELELNLASKAKQVDALSEERYEVFEQAKQEKRRAEGIAKAYGLSSIDLHSNGLKSEQNLVLRNLRWPVSGKRLRGFGAYVDPLFETNHFSNGWLIQSTPKAEVHVIESGKVIYSGWFKGYGNLVIVQHSTRVHSLYAQLGALRVRANETVSIDDVIALTRQDRDKNSGQVYFEIRKDKVAFDPKLVLNVPRAVSKGPR
jgi:murein hydrolase activator